MRYYVYHLIDPRSDEVFYVGKGCGRRIDEHEKEAKRGFESQKCEVIRQIWQDGAQVKKIKVKAFPVEQDAFDFEVREIARIGLARLTNVQSGGGKGTVKDVFASQYAARWFVEKFARVVYLYAQGKRLSDPWQQALDSMFLPSIRTLVKYHGEKFIAGEFSKYGVRAVFEGA